jgi:predicted MFS family arabinose efflux permease
MASTDSVVAPGLAPAFAGASGTFSGLGLARFAYVPLFPAMVGAGWVSGGEAGLLGALNLGGYVLGVVSGRRIGRALGTVAALDLGMALVIASFAGCAWNGGVAWLAACRALAGVAGGILMVLAGPAVQGVVAPQRRGLAGGIVMTGVGTGAVVGALAVPALLGSAGIVGTWLGLALLVLAVWAVARLSWPTTPVVIVPGAPPSGTGRLSLSYGLSAAGLVPHMVYLADIVVRGQGFAISWGAGAFLGFACGGLLGPLAGGRAVDRLGAATAFRIWLAIQVVAVALLFVPLAAALVLGGFLGGFASIGLTAVTLARTREIAGAAAGGVWARTTLAFAFAQAVIGLLMAGIFSLTASHTILLAIALAFSLAAFIPVLPRR